MSTSFANFGFLQEVPLSLPAIFEQTIIALRWDIYSKNLFMNYCKLSLSAFIVNLSSLWKQLPFRYLLYQHRYRCVCEGTILVSRWDISLWIIVRLWKQVPLRYLPNRRRYHCNLWAAVCQYSLTLSAAWSASPVNLCVILAFNALHSYTAAAMLTIYNVNYNPQPEAPVLLIACVSLTQASFYLSVSLMLLYNMKTNILQTIARTGFITSVTTLESR